MYGITFSLDESIMYGITFSLMIIFLLNIYIFVNPIKINQSLVVHYKKYRHAFVMFGQALLSVSTERRFLFFILYALTYYAFVYVGTNVLLVINVIGLCLIINFRWILIHYKKLKREISKRGNQPLNIEERSREIHRLIHYFLPQYFAFLFYFAIGGLPIASFYAYCLFVHRDGKFMDYWLYLPTRIYWLLLIVALWIFSQGVAEYSLNFKQRNLTDTLNGTWLESLVVGMLNTKVIIKNHDQKIVIGEEGQPITIDQCLLIFYALNLSPFLLIFVW